MSRSKGFWFFSKNGQPATKVNLSSEHPCNHQPIHLQLCQISLSKITPDTIRQDIFNGINQLKNLIYVVDCSKIKIDDGLMSESEIFYVYKVLEVVLKKYPGIMFRVITPRSKSAFPSMVPPNPYSLNLSFKTIPQINLLINGQTSVKLLKNLQLMKLPVKERFSLKMDITIKTKLQTNIQNLKCPQEDTGIPLTQLPQKINEMPGEKQLWIISPIFFDMIPSDLFTNDTEKDFHKDMKKVDGLLPAGSKYWTSSIKDEDHLPLFDNIIVVQHTRSDLRDRLRFMSIHSPDMESMLKKKYSAVRKFNDLVYRTLSKVKTVNLVMKDTKDKPSGFIWV